MSETSTAILPSASLAADAPQHPLASGCHLLHRKNLDLQSVCVRGCFCTLCPTLCACLQFAAGGNYGAQDACTQNGGNVDPTHDFLSVFDQCVGEQYYVRNSILRSLIYAQVCANQTLASAHSVHMCRSFTNCTYATAGLSFASQGISSKHLAYKCLADIVSFSSICSKCD